MEERENSGLIGQYCIQKAFLVPFCILAVHGIWGLKRIINLSLDVF